MRHQDWPFHQFFAAGFGPRSRAWCGPEGAGPRHRRRRHQMFEAGEVKDVILRLLKEKPRHGYEIMRALEERMGGWYTPSAGTVYPTLQLLEDMGYVRVEESEGKKTYHLTPAGDAFLEEHRDVIDPRSLYIHPPRGRNGRSLNEATEEFVEETRMGGKSSG